MEETEEMQHLKACLTEKNAEIEFLRNRNIELTKQKRQAVAAKIKWRELYKSAFELLTDEQRDELSTMIETNIEI